ncbi:MAG: hypothetical protein KC431_21220, partial [Myxococcales bacterium]|nr:hypothetical protein [Myxococcales bacterium]
EVTPDCVPVDEKLGDPAGRMWCDGEYFPLDLEWEGEIPIDTLTVCLSPEADGTCNLCPTAEIADAVEIGMREYLTEYRPACQLQHWELGCMRTIENGMKLEREEGYCCFQVATWGNDECR